MEDVVDINDRLLKTVISFIINPWDNLNVKAMGNFIGELWKLVWSKFPQYKDLHKYLDLVLEATSHVLLNEEIQINMKFLDEIVAEERLKKRMEAQNEQWKSTDKI